MEKGNFKIGLEKIIYLFKLTQIAGTGVFPHQVLPSQQALPCFTTIDFFGSIQEFSVEPKRINRFDAHQRRNHHKNDRRYPVGPRDRAMRGLYSFASDHLDLDFRDKLIGLQRSVCHAILCKSTATH